MALPIVRSTDCYLSINAHAFIRHLIQRTPTVSYRRRAQRACLSAPGAPPAGIAHDDESTDMSLPASQRSTWNVRIDEGCCGRHPDALRQSVLAGTRKVILEPFRPIARWISHGPPTRRRLSGSAVATRHFSSRLHRPSSSRSATLRLDSAHVTACA
jgi:hypothetical protein